MKNFLKKLISWFRPEIEVPCSRELDEEWARESC